MKQKINKYFIVLLIILVAFLSFLTIYKVLLKNDSIGKSKELLVEEDKKQGQTSGDFSNKYLDYNKKIEYDIVENESGISGYIQIDDMGYMYIYDLINKENKQISKLKFLTLREHYNTSSLLSIYAISEDNNLYNIYLDNTNINEVIIKKINIPYLTTRFVDLYFTSPEFTNRETFMILTKEEKIYDIITGLFYSKDIKYLNGGYYVYSDDTIANSYGNIIRDELNMYVKVKYYIETWRDDRPFENVNSIIITSKNKIMYSEINSEYVKFYGKNIKDIKFTVKSSATNEYNITLTMEDGELLKFTGLCYENYYALN